VAWVNLDDGFPDHPKVAGLSDRAFRLQVSGICYANRHLTDGIVPASVVPRLVGVPPGRALVELIDGALWTPILGSTEAYSIHDYLDWNRSREQVLAERERRSRAGRKGAEARWHEP
jgi:hypothetical protein